MSIKELKEKVRDLRNEAADLDKLFHYAVISYLNTIVGVASCCDDNTDGKACLEEICNSYDSESDLVTIEYIIMNEYKDFVETKQIKVSAFEIEKYILI